MMNFDKVVGVIATGAVLCLSLAGMVQSAPAAAVQLWRLDCGEIWVADLDEYSDTHAYTGQSRRMVASCYLIRHGDSYMLWDTGLDRTALGKSLVEGSEDSEALATTLVDQLARIGVRPGQISRIGVSHYHFDHTGQAADFPAATLMMGKADLDALRAPGSARAKPLAHWIGGGGTVEEVSGDKDVFGDGRVVMLDLPGHTPGHHGLLVRLGGGRTVLLSGDVAHFRENLDSNGVPGFNADRARSLASLDRFKALGRNLKAVVVIQHDSRDIDKLPIFPRAAE